MSSGVPVSCVKPAEVAWMFSQAGSKQEVPFPAQGLCDSRAWRENCSSCSPGKEVAKGAQVWRLG